MPADNLLYLSQSFLHFSMQSHHSSLVLDSGHVASVFFIHFYYLESVLFSLGLVETSLTTESLSNASCVKLVSMRDKYVLHVGM